MFQLSPKKQVKAFKLASASLIFRPLLERLLRATFDPLG